MPHKLKNCDTVVTEAPPLDPPMHEKRNRKTTGAGVKRIGIDIELGWGEAGSWGEANRYRLGAGVKRIGKIYILTLFNSTSLETRCVSASAQVTCCDVVLEVLFGAPAVTCDILCCHGNIFTNNR